MNILLVFVKYPEPGKVKTRLGRCIGFEQAADLYRVFLEQTFEMANKSDAEQVLLAVEPPEQLPFFEEMAPSFRCFPQFEGGLGMRLMKAFESALETLSARVVAIGSDSPTLPVEFVNEAFVKLSETDLVLGPADDGGYYLIGMRRLLKPLFENIPWSTDKVFEKTLSQAGKHQISRFVLPSWYDVDDQITLQRAARDEASGKIRAYMEKEIPNLK